MPVTWRRPDGEVPARAGIRPGRAWPVAALAIDMVVPVRLAEGHLTVAVVRGNITTVTHSLSPVNANCRPDDGCARPAT